MYCTVQHYNIFLPIRKKEVRGNEGIFVRRTKKQGTDVLQAESSSYVLMYVKICLLHILVSVVRQENTWAAEGHETWKIQMW
jgi:hypothetical protein